MLEAPCSFQSAGRDLGGIPHSLGVAQGYTNLPLRGVTSLFTNSYSLPTCRFALPPEAGLRFACLCSTLYAFSLLPQKRDRLFEPGLPRGVMLTYGASCFACFHFSLLRYSPVRIPETHQALKLPPSGFPWGMATCRTCFPGASPPSGIYTGSVALPGHHPERL